MNIERLKMPVRSIPASPTAPRPAPGKHFLRGPIPLDWLESAAKLPGAATQVSIYLWYLAGLKKSGSFPVPASKVNASLGVSRFALYRALSGLEQAGLISVARHRGRHAVVTLRGCPVPQEPEEGRQA